MGNAPGSRVPVNRTQTATLKSLPWKLSSPWVPWFGIFTAPVPSNVKAWPTIPGAKVTPPCNVPLLVMLWMLSALPSAGHQAAMFGGGDIQGAKGSASAGWLLRKLQVAMAIRHVQRANLAVISSVFIVDGCFPIPSLKFASRCKENDGSHNALRVALRCISLTSEQQQLANYFGAGEATILDTNFTNPHELKQNSGD